MPTSVQTLVYIINPRNEVLLPVKGRKIGAGKRMGPGGKKERSDGTIFTCASRETLTEVGIKLWKMEHCGVITYRWEDRPDHCNQVHIIAARGYRYANGIGPIETDEMRDPRWFHVDRLPWAEMWSSDPLWMPPFFRGEPVWFNVLYRGEATLRCEPVQPFDIRHLF